MACEQLKKDAETAHGVLQIAIEAEAQAQQNVTDKQTALNEAMAALTNATATKKEKAQDSKTAYDAYIACLVGSGF